MLKDTFYIRQDKNDVGLLKEATMAHKSIAKIL